MLEMAAKMKTLPSLILTVLVMSTACASAPPPADEALAVQASLAFLEDGKTTKGDLQARLGAPSGEFRRGGIWTYGTLPSGYQLVVVFDDKDVVKGHRLLKVKP